MLTPILFPLLLDFFFTDLIKKLKCPTFLKAKHIFLQYICQTKSIKYQYIYFDKYILFHYLDFYFTKIDISSKLLIKKETNSLLIFIYKQFYLYFSNHITFDGTNASFKVLSSVDEPVDHICLSWDKSVISMCPLHWSNNKHTTYIKKGISNELPVFCVYIGYRKYLTFLFWWSFQYFKTKFDINFIYLTYSILIFFCKVLTKLIIAS